MKFEIQISVQEFWEEKIFSNLFYISAASYNNF